MPNAYGALIPRKFVHPEFDRATIRQMMQLRWNQLEAYDPVTKAQLLRSAMQWGESLFDTVWDCNWDGRHTLMWGESPREFGDPDWNESEGGSYG